MSHHDETAPLRRVLLKHARDAFVSQARLDRDWRALNYLGRPDFDLACRQSDALAGLLEGLGCAVEWLPADGGTGPDSIYVRDNAVLTPAGMVLCRMGKEARAPEPAAQARWYADAGVPVLGAIEAPGRLEGGDLIWLDAVTVCVGEGYRTNAEGIRRLARLLGPSVEVVVVPLVHWAGPDDVFHLMSIISPLAPDLALVHSRLMPVTFRARLLDRGMALVEVPDAEFDSMGGNVLAVAPRTAVMLDGNPETRRRLEAAGCAVHVYDGSEISAKGCGGPTCLTRPLARG